MNGTELIAAERRRQIEAEGWTSEHDAHHTKGQLAWAAACYVAPESVYRVELHDSYVAWREPWPIEWVPNANRGEPGYVPWRRPATDRIRELVKAGALIAAEIDRLQAVTR